MYCNRKNQSFIKLKEEKNKRQKSKCVSFAAFLSLSRCQVKVGGGKQRTQWGACRVWHGMVWWDRVVLSMVWWGEVRVGYSMVG